MVPRPPLSRGKRKGGNPDIVPAECPLRWGPCCGSGATLAPGPSLSYPSFSRRKPGPRDHGALDGNQKDIGPPRDRKSTRLNSSHVASSFAVFCLKKKKQ